MSTELTDEQKAMLDQAVACCGREAVLAKLYSMMAIAERREAAGYPAGEAPGASMADLLPFRNGGTFRTLPTEDGDWDETKHYEEIE